MTSDSKNLSRRTALAGLAGVAAAGLPRPSPPAGQIRSMPPSSGTGPP